ncbi:hypothetical protein NQZ68_023643 [Dissostichus eleginoides]|nr:hypothetical protein NQZ68_023643 [Dissostichus eleginoides]
MDTTNHTQKQKNWIVFTYVRIGITMLSVIKVKIAKRSSYQLQRISSRRQSHFSVAHRGAENKKKKKKEEKEEEATLPLAACSLTASNELRTSDGGDKMRFKD